MAPRLTLALVLSLVASPALAGELDAQTVAKIQLEKQQELERIAKAHGNRKPSEMSPAERKQVIREQAEADRRVLEKHRVEAKELARFTARMSRAQRAEVEAAAKALKAKQAEEAKGAPKEPSEVKVQRGFSDERPVELEASEGAPPVVEQGIPVGEE